MSLITSQSPRQDGYTMFRKYSAQHIGKTAVDATRDYLIMNAPTSDRAMPAPAEGRIDQVAILGRLPY